MNLPEEKIEEHIQRLEGKASQLRVGMEGHTYNMERLKASGDRALKHLAEGEELLIGRISDHHRDLGQTIFFLKSLLCDDDADQN